MRGVAHFQNSKAFPHNFLGRYTWKIQINASDGFGRLQIGALWRVWSFIKGIDHHVFPKEGGLSKRGVLTKTHNITYITKWPAWEGVYFRGILRFLDFWNFKTFGKCRAEQNFLQRWISENGIFSQRWISENGIFSTQRWISEKMQSGADSKDAIARDKCG